MLSSDSAARSSSDSLPSSLSSGRFWFGLVLIVVGLFGLYQYWPQTSIHEPAAASVVPQPEVDAAEKQHTSIKRQIQDVYPGMRATAHNPTDEVDLTFGTEVDPETWKQLIFKAPKKAGGYADVWLLRPDKWIAEQKAEVGKTVSLTLPEVGIEGPAEVLKIEPCPEIQSGPGRVITGRFVHHDAELIDLKFASESKSIGTTPNHPFWSEDKQEFVRADELQEGEKVRTLSALTYVESISPRSGRHTVYNLEVQYDHVYHVGDGGVLVHNTCDEVIPLDAFESAARTRGIASSQSVSAIPKGFKSTNEFNQFGQRLKEGFRSAGYNDVRAIFQGSAVTGKKFTTGQPFDVGRISDFDIALASPTLMSRAKKLGIGLRSRGTRTEPLTEEHIKLLGLSELVRDLSSQAKREVNFMIYQSVETAVQRAPSIQIP